MSVEFQAFWEAVIGVLLLVGAGVLIVSNSYKEVVEIYVFAAVLVLESLPFLSAVAIAILENSRVNDFAFWRNTRVRTAELIGLRPVAMPKTISAPQPVASEVTSDFGTCSTIAEVEKSEKSSLPAPAVPVPRRKWTEVQGEAS